MSDFFVPMSNELHEGIVFSIHSMRLLPVVAVIYVVGEIVAVTISAVAF